jgi:tetratricopeptide (TPR) repeat protein
LGNLVRVYQQLCQYTKALDAAQKSLQMEGRLGSLEDIAQTHLTVGILYESLGVFDLAGQHIEMAANRFLATDNKKMIGWSHLTRAYLSKDINNIELALQELDALDELLVEIKDDDLKSWSMLTRADLYFELGRFDETEEILSALEKEPSVEFELRKELLELKVTSIKRDLVPEEALQNLAKECAQNQFFELQWEVYAALGAIYERKKESPQSEQSYQLAFEIIERIAAGLAEAYRDSYRQQRYRIEIIQKIAPESVVGRHIYKKSTVDEETLEEAATTDFKKYIENK